MDQPSQSLNQLLMFWIIGSPVIIHQSPPQMGTFQASVQDVKRHRMHREVNFPQCFAFRVFTVISCFRCPSLTKRWIGPSWYSNATFDIFVQQSTWNATSSLKRQGYCSSVIRCHVFGVRSVLWRRLLISVGLRGLNSCNVSTMWRD